MSLLIFYILAAVILISGLLVVTLRNVFHSALFLVLAFFMVAGIYVMLHAEFLAAAQVLIYVGAVTILMLFAIMLTYQIQSKSIRQTNEQVIPAAIISAIFLALAIFALTRTFGNVGAPRPNVGGWTSSVRADELSDIDDQWNWTLSIADEEGKNYIAGGKVVLTSSDVRGRVYMEAADAGSADGYVLSPSPDHSTISNVYGKEQTIYMKAWSQNVDYGKFSEAFWTLTSFADNTKTITKKLSNSNPEAIGRLLMTKYVLPFEVVSVLLLVALMGAIVIARKDF